MIESVTTGNKNANICRKFRATDDDVVVNIEVSYGWVFKKMSSF